MYNNAFRNSKGYFMSNKNIVENISHLFKINNTEAISFYADYFPFLDKDPKSNIRDKQLFCNYNLEKFSDFKFDDCELYLKTYFKECSLNISFYFDNEENYKLNTSNIKNHFENNIESLESNPFFSDIVIKINDDISTLILSIDISFIDKNELMQENLFCLLFQETLENIKNVSIEYDELVPLYKNIKNNMSHFSMNTINNKLEEYSFTDIDSFKETIELFCSC